MSNGTTDARQKMIELLETKRPAARFFHGAISAGSSNLNDLFTAEDYDAILDFLESGTSVRDPVRGEPLIVPGKPDESAFFLQMTRIDGVMFGRFLDDEVAPSARGSNNCRQYRAILVRLSSFDPNVLLLD